jgi:hypothetical protein
MILELPDAQGRQRKILVEKGTKTHGVYLTACPGNRVGEYEGPPQYLKPQADAWYQQWKTVEQLQQKVQEAQYRDLQAV